MRGLLLLAMGSMALGAAGAAGLGYLRLTRVQTAFQESLQGSLSERARAVEEVKKAQAEWQRELAGVAVMNEELQRQVERFGNQVPELTQERQVLLDRMKGLLKERSETQEEVARARTEREQTGTLVSDLREEAAQLLRQLADLKGEVQRQREGAARWKAASEQLEKKLAEPRQQPPKDESEKLPAAFQEEKERLLREVARFKEGAASIPKLQATLEATAKEKARLERDLKQESALAQAAHAERAKTQGELKDLQTQEGQARKDQATLHLRLSNLEKDQATLYLRLGNLEAARGNLDQAEAAYRKGIELRPSLALAHYNLAVLYEEYLQDPARAIQEYQTYLRLAPQAHDAKEVEGWLALLRVQGPSGKERQDWGRPGVREFSKTLKQVLQ